MVLRYTIYTVYEVTLALCSNKKKNTLQELGKESHLTLHNFFLQCFLLLRS